MKQRRLIGEGTQKSGADWAGTVGAAGFLGRNHSLALSSRAGESDRDRASRL